MVDKNVGKPGEDENASAVAEQADQHDNRHDDGHEEVTRLRHRIELKPMATDTQ